MNEEKNKADGAADNGEYSASQDDAAVNSDAAVGSNATTTDDTPETLKEKLRVCEKERDEYLDGWKRAKADAMNDKKRQQKLLESERNAALMRYATAMLPILDSLRVALSESSDSDFRSGIERVHTQCIQSFNTVGIEILDPIGQKFDPHRHQAVGEREVSDAEQGDTVVEVVRVGALSGEMVVRAAMVYTGVYKEQ